jgi:hypothetical protein
MNIDLTLSEWASVATILGAIFAVLTLLYTAYQIRLSTRISAGTFWLELEKMFANHDEVHIKLRPGGVWANNKGGPENVEDWAKVEDYMGLFEHCEIMLQKKLIDWKTFQAIFAYRIHNILVNKMIVQAKLKNEKDSWRAFLRLLKRMKVDISV